jgi:hypothetical protein
LRRNQWLEWIGTTGCFAPDSAVDLADTLQHVDEEGINRDQRVGVGCLDVALAEPWAEALQQPDLLVGQADLPLGRGLLRAQQAVMLGQQAMALPDAAHAAGGDLEAQHQLLGDAHWAMAGMRQGMLQDRLLDRFRHAVGKRVAWAWQPIDQAVGTVCLEVAADLVELLAAVADHLAGLGYVAEVGRQLEQAELAPCYLLLRGNAALRTGLMLLAKPS